MKYKAILFDMDGTLVPMNMEEFLSGYFKLLCVKLEKYGVEPQKLVDAVWAGTAAMVKNDGSRKNHDAFWEVFAKLTGIKDVETCDKDCLDFYGNEFQLAVKFTQPNPLAKEAIRLAHEKADHVILATNPLFPMVGQRTRMSWVGLMEEDFELVTSYESDSFCKPNVKYYESIFERIGVKPEECLMIGNDENEDMYAGSLAGMDCFLVTDTQIKSKDHPWTGPKGTFEEMVKMLEKL